MGTSGTVTVRYFAAARAAAGMKEETVEVAEAVDRAGFTRVLTERHPSAPPGEPTLARVLPQCSLLVDGVALTEGQRVDPGSHVDVLPPFAGG